MEERDTIRFSVALDKLQFPRGIIDDAQKDWLENFYLKNSSGVFELLKNLYKINFPIAKLTERKFEILLDIFATDEETIHELPEALKRFVKLMEDDGKKIKDIPEMTDGDLEKKAKDSLEIHCASEGTFGFLSESLLKDLDIDLQQVDPDAKDAIKKYFSEYPQKAKDINELLRERQICNDEIKYAKNAIDKLAKYKGKEETERRVGTLHQIKERGLPEAKGVFRKLVSFITRKRQKPPTEEEAIEHSSLDAETLIDEAIEEGKITKKDLKDPKKAEKIRQEYTLDSDELSAVYNLETFYKGLEEAEKEIMAELNDLLVNTVNTIGKVREHLEKKITRLQADDTRAAAEQASRLHQRKTGKEGGVFTLQAEQNDEEKEKEIKEKLAEKFRNDIRFAVAAATMPYAPKEKFVIKIDPKTGARSIVKDEHGRDKKVEFDPTTDPEYIREFTEKIEKFLKPHIDKTQIGAYGREFVLDAAIAELRAIQGGLPSQRLNEQLRELKVEKDKIRNAGIEKDKINENIKKLKADRIAEPTEDITNEINELGDADKIVNFFNTFKAEVGKLESGSLTDDTEKQELLKNLMILEKALENFEKQMKEEEEEINGRDILLKDQNYNLRIRLLIETGILERLEREKRKLDAESGIEDQTPNTIQTSRRRQVTPRPASRTAQTRSRGGGQGTQSQSAGQPKDHPQQKRRGIFTKVADVFRGRTVSIEDDEGEPEANETEAQTIGWEEFGKNASGDYEVAIVVKRIKKNEHKKDDKIIVDFKGANLEGADLFGTDIEGADLTGANLEGAILRLANLKGADLRGANLKEAILYNADLTGIKHNAQTNFTDVEADGTTKMEADVKQKIEDSKTTPTAPPAAPANPTQLLHAQPEDKTLFEDAQLIIEMRENLYKFCSDEQGNRLSIPEIAEKIRNSKHINDDTIVINFAEIDLQNADLEGADLEGADLKKAKLNNTNLRDINLKEAKLRETNFTSAKMQEAKLNNADLSLAILIETNLFMADLREATLHKASMINIILQNADLRGADLERADLRGADLIGVEFDTSTNFKDIKIDLLTKMSDNLRARLMDDGIITETPDEDGEIVIDDADVEDETDTTLLLPPIPQQAPEAPATVTPTPAPDESTTSDGEPNEMGVGHAPTTSTGHDALNTADQERSFFAPAPAERQSEDESSPRESERIEIGKKPWLGDTLDIGGLFYENGRRVRFEVPGFFSNIDKNSLQRYEEGLWFGYSGIEGESDDWKLIFALKKTGGRLFFKCGGANANGEEILQTPDGYVDLKNKILEAKDEVFKTKTPRLGRAARTPDTTQPTPEQQPKTLEEIIAEKNKKSKYKYVASPSAKNDPDYASCLTDENFEELEKMLDKFLKRKPKNTFKQISLNTGFNIIKNNNLGWNPKNPNWREEMWKELQKYEKPLKMTIGFLGVGGTLNIEGIFDTDDEEATIKAEEINKVNYNGKKIKVKPFLDPISRDKCSVKASSDLTGPNSYEIFSLEKKNGVLVYSSPVRDGGREIIIDASLRGQPEAYINEDKQKAFEIAVERKKNEEDDKYSESFLTIEDVIKKINEIYPVFETKNGKSRLKFFEEDKDKINNKGYFKKILKAAKKLSDILTIQNLDGYVKYFYLGGTEKTSNTGQGMVFKLDIEDPEWEQKLKTYIEEQKTNIQRINDVDELEIKLNRDYNIKNAIAYLEKKYPVLSGRLTTFKDENYTRDLIEKYLLPKAGELSKILELYKESESKIGICCGDSPSMWHGEGFIQLNITEDDWEKKLKELLKIDSIRNQILKFTREKTKLNNVDYSLYSNTSPSEDYLKAVKDNLEKLEGLLETIIPPDKNIKVYFNNSGGNNIDERFFETLRWDPTDPDWERKIREETEKLLENDRIRDQIFDFIRREKKLNNVNYKIYTNTSLSGDYSKVVSDNFKKLENLLLKYIPQEKTIYVFLSSYLNGIDTTYENTLRWDPTEPDWEQKLETAIKELTGV